AAPHAFNNNVNPDRIGAALASAAHVVSGSYAFPYNGHMPLGPLCVIADVTPNGALLYSNSQGVFSQRTKVAAVLGLPENVVRIRYYEGAGSYGSGSHYDEAAEAAALMSQLVGKPVRLQFMRWDEHGWDNYGPAHLAEVHAAVDAGGNMLAYEYHGWQHGWTTRATVYDLALNAPATERREGSNSITVNPISTGSMYVIPN